MISPQTQSFTIFAFVSLFTMVNPIGVVPPYMAMTTGMSQHQSRTVALRATMTALVILLLFALTGEFIFSFFGISGDALRVVGGIIFLGLGYRMLLGRPPREREPTESHDDFATDISITPLGIPIVCGPGAIATVILLTTEESSALHYGITAAVIVTIMALTFLAMVFGRRIMAFFGENGTIVLLRLMGLIIMAIAVEFLVTGLTPIVREMLEITPAG
jgi:multiple antibiotic resistance protein